MVTLLLSQQFVQLALLPPDEVFLNALEVSPLVWELVSELQQWPLALAKALASHLAVVAVVCQPEVVCHHYAR